MFCGKASELAREVGTPHSIGLATLMSGITTYLNGEWRRSVALLEQAEVILREQCTGTAWEVTSCQSFLLRSFTYLGEMGEVSRRLPGQLAAALDRGNLYAATELRTRANLVWLAGDDPEGARREIAEAMRQWSQGVFHRQHYNSMLSETDIFLYTDDAPAAWRRVTERWSELSRSLLLRVQLLRVEATHLRARAAVTMALAGDDAERWRRTAERLARGIARERTPWSDPLALLVQAAVADGRRDAAAAASLLRSAADAFSRADMGLYAAVARRRLGAIAGVSGGADLVAEADAWMRAHGVRRPDLMIRVLAPGFRMPAPPTP
jgi:hypothetical protein